MEIAEALDDAVLDGLRELDRGGDGTFFRRVVEAYLADAPSRLGDLRRGVSEKDPARTARAAHALKGSCRNIGAKRLAALCETLERLGGKEGLHSAGEILRQVEREFALVELALARGA